MTKRAHVIKYLFTGKDTLGLTINGETLCTRQNIPTWYKDSKLS